MALADMTQPGRADRLRAAIARDGPTCVWCSRRFTDLVRPTTEHLVPRIKGGPSWLENEVAACRRCNSARGHQGITQWAEECHRRGWEPDVARVVRVLHGLDSAIRARGGQRRARPYIAHELRRLARLERGGLVRTTAATGRPARATGRDRAPGT